MTAGPKIGWYRRRFTVRKNFPNGEPIWLQFGAVDWRADVWVNGRKVAEHAGGYTPFEADITDALRPDGVAIVTVEDRMRGWPAVIAKEKSALRQVVGDPWRSKVGRFIAGSVSRTNLGR